jgi:hypothetical protein
MAGLRSHLAALDRSLPNAIRANPSKRFKNQPQNRGAARAPHKKPRRSRANLRPRSRSASVIDRLFKNQNLLENRNNLRSSSPRPGPGQTFGQPRRNFAVRNSSTRVPWLFRSPVFGSGIRRLERDRIVITGADRFQPARPEVLR